MQLCNSRGIVWMYSCRFFCLYRIQQSNNVCVCVYFRDSIKSNEWFYCIFSIHFVSDRIKMPNLCSPQQTTRRKNKEYYIGKWNAGASTSAVNMTEHLNTFKTKSVERKGIFFCLNWTELDFCMQSNWWYTTKQHTTRQKSRLNGLQQQQKWIATDH